MLVVFALVGWIGVGALHALMSTHAQALQEQALVSSLQRENRALARKQASYNEPATIERSARALGMVKSGEKTFAVTGLDGP
jgi:cell division protein FtsB